MRGCSWNGKCDLATTLEDSRSALQAARNSVLTGLHLLALGFVRTMNGNLRAAGVHYREALEIFDASGYESLTHQAASDIADNAWAQGDLDAAAMGFEAAIARLRGSRYELTSSSARRYATWRVCSPSRKNSWRRLSRPERRFRCSSIQARWVSPSTCWRFGWRSALASADAARLHGCSIAAYATSKLAARESNEQRMYDSVAALLREHLTPPELHDRIAEGMALAEAQACRLALAS